jgi:hypothetical protein
MYPTAVTYKAPVAYSTGQREPLWCRSGYGMIASELDEIDGYFLYATDISCLKFAEIYPSADKIICVSKKLPLMQDLSDFLACSCQKPFAPDP